jgi:hypothetical protein
MKMKDVKKSGIGVVKPHTDEVVRQIKVVQAPKGVVITREQLDRGSPWHDAPKGKK